MGVKLEAFLAIETTLTERLAGTCNNLFADLYKAIEKAIQNEEWDKALRLVKTIHTEPVYTLNEEYIRYLSGLAMLFGASMISKSPTNTRVGLGFEKETIDSLMLVFKNIITTKVQGYLQDSALSLIAFRKARDNEEESIHKSEGAYLGTMVIKTPWHVMKASKAAYVLPFESFMEKSGKTTFNIASSLHTSRLSAYGFTAEARVRNITEYQINEQLDGRTCAVCRVMHGKVFPVSDARGFLDTVIRTQDPAELAMLQPWPSQSKGEVAKLEKMSSEELVMSGWHVPPFHPRCRGLLMKSGRIPDLDEPPEEEIPLDYEATQADFEALGAKLPKAAINQWNSLVKTPPAEVVGALIGKTPTQILTLASKSSDVLKDLGVSITGNSVWVNIETKGLAHGSKKPIEQSIYFKKKSGKAPENIYIAGIEFDKEDVGKFKTVMKSIYGIAKNSPAKTMSVITGLDTGGYAFAKYGFGVNAQKWEYIKKEVRGKIKNTDIMSKATALEQKTIGFILDSDNPESLFALADVPIVGRKLLEDIVWEAMLDFDSAEAMTRFLTYLG